MGVTSVRDLRMVTRGILVLPMALGQWTISRQKKIEPMKPATSTVKDKLRPARAIMIRQPNLAIGKPMMQGITVNQGKKMMCSR